MRRPSSNTRSTAPPWRRSANSTCLIAVLPTTNSSPATPADQAASDSPWRRYCWRRGRKSLQTGSAETHGIVADVATAEGRAATLEQTLAALGGLDVLVNNAGGVRAGRLENTDEVDLQAMIDVDLTAPILLTRAALPVLRKSGDAMVVNVSSTIALVGAPFYATYAAVKAGLAHFGEALRRELKGERIHVLTVYPGGTDTPMMKSNRAGPELGFSREPASAVDDRFLGLKPALEEAVKDHSAL